MESNICRTACAAPASSSVPGGLAPLVVISPPHHCNEVFAALPWPQKLGAPSLAFETWETTALNSPAFRVLSLSQHIHHGRFQLSRRHILYDSRIADPNRQHKSPHPTYILLVAAGGRHHLCRTQLQSRQWAIEMNQPLQPVKLPGADRPSRAGQVKRSHHAPSNRLAVKKNLVARDLLNSMTHRVAEVQDHAQPVFTVIDVDHFSLHEIGRAH